MEKPILSSDFTMEDLYKIREYNSLRHKGMTTEEIQEDLKESIAEFNELIKSCKKEKELVIY